MTRFAVLSLALAFAVSASAATYEARTPHHGVSLDVVSTTGDDVVFNVTISELPGGRVLTSTRMSGKAGSPIEKQIDVADGQHVTIRVMSRSNSVGFRVEIAKGDLIIDSIQSAGATQPMFSPFAPVGPPFRVGGDVSPPVVLVRVEPVYPAVARKARIAGIVVIEAIIGRTGVVKDARVLKPLPFGLDQAAIEAVRQWKFRPGRLYGKPVDVVFTLTVAFRLPEPPPEPPPQ